MKLLNTKKTPVYILITMALAVIITSAIWFISKALYMENEVEIIPELKSNLKLVRCFNYENEKNFKSMIEFNFKEKIEYNNNYYSSLKSNIVYLQIPKINETLPTSVDVISVSSKLINGENTQKNAQYEYNNENGIIKIWANNEKTYSGSSTDIDEYEIVLNYSNKMELNEENKKIVVPYVIQYQSSNEEIGAIQEKFEKEIILQEKGNLIDTEIKTSKIYNGYINCNISNNTEYETEFTQESRIHINYLDVDNITIQELNGFKSEQIYVDGINYIKYKNIKINKADVITVLGENGYLQLLDDKGNILLNINKETEDENNEVQFNAVDEINNIYLKMSKPIKNGLIRINTKKAITGQMKDINNKNLITAQKITANKKIQENNLIEQEKTIIENTNVDIAEIQQSVTKINSTINNKEWTNSIQNDVNIEVDLINSNEKYSLFKNPKIQIELPEEVEKVVLGESYILNANGLNIEAINLQEDGKSILLTLTGSQTEYLFNNMINGTKVVIPATIILNKEFESKDGNININYINETATGKETGNQQIQVNMQSITKTSEKKLEVNTDVLQNLGSNIQNIKDNNGLSVDVVAKVGDTVVSRNGTDSSKEVQNGNVFERQVIKYEVTLTNNTQEAINNISVIGGIPNYTKYATIKHGSYWDMNVTYEYIPDSSVANYELENLSSLNPGETKKAWYEVLVDDIDNNLNSVDILNNVTVKIQNEEYDIYTLNNKINQAEIDVKLKSAYNREGDDTFAYEIAVTNLTESDLSSVYVELPNIPKELSYVKSVVALGINTSGNGQMENNKFVATIDSISSNQTKRVLVYFLANNYDDAINELELKMSATASINNNVYQSNENRITAYPQYVTATMTLDKEGQEVHYGDELTYTINVKNESKVRTEFNVIYNLPEGIDGIKANWALYDVGEQRKTEYDLEEEANADYNLVENEKDFTAKIPDKDDIDINTVLPAGKSITITIKAKAGYVNKDTIASSFATITGNSIKQVTTNTTTVKVLTEVDWDYISGKTDGGNEEPDNPNENTNTNNTTNENTNSSNTNVDNSSNLNNTSNEANTSNTSNATNTSNTSNVTPKDNEKESNSKNNTNTYSISGLTWLDQNQDGRRTDDEKTITNVTVKIYNAETNSIVAINNNKLISEVNKKGEYKFNNIPSGKYYCLFEYDTQNYEITAYKKSGVSESFNNDATKAEVSIDGVVKNVAITDALVLNNDLSNIDLGLIENNKFDLKLEKYISKVNVKTNAGDKEYTYNNTDLAKVEIASKYMEGAQITIEYKIIVTNVGNAAGYISEVTDYMPSELEFLQDKNSGWEKTNNGNLVNKTLIGKPLNVGESKTLTLYLNKTMTKDSIGNIKNSAEITKSNNLKNLKDINLTDNVDSAEIIISVKTGLYKNMFIVIFTIFTLIGLIFIIKKYNKKLPTIFILFFAMILFLGDLNHIFAGVTYTSYIYNYEINDNGQNSGNLIGKNGESWHCSTSGLVQCDTAWHRYTVEITKELIEEKEEQYISGLRLNVTGNPQFIEYSSSEALIGPYTATISSSSQYDTINLRSYTVTATVDGVNRSVTMCDQRGNSIGWSSGRSRTFYIKAPINCAVVNSVSVEATVKNVKKVITTYNIEYYGWCTSVQAGNVHGRNFGDHQGVSVNPSAVQDAYRSETTTEVTYEDASIRGRCTTPAYSGSLEIYKKDGNTGASISANSGARFTIRGTNGDNYVKTNVAIGQRVYGLVPGRTYTVTETTAPSGYELSLQTQGGINVRITGNGTTDKVTLENKKYTNLDIYKKDEETNDAIEGIGFTIYDNHYRKYINESGNQTNTPVILYTGADGHIRINNVPLYDENTTFTITEAASNNLYYKADSRITGTITGKSNATVSWSMATITNKKSYSLTLNKKDPDDSGAKVDAKFIVQYEDGSYLGSDGSYGTNPTEISTVNGTVKIERIKRGTYTIFETETLTDRYFVNWQKDFDEAKGWKNFGTITVDDSTSDGNFTKIAENEKSYSLTIIKEDKEAPQDKKKIEASFIVLYESSAQRPGDLDIGKWISEDGVYSTRPTEISTTNGEAKLKYMKPGTYHIYETQIDSGYKLEWQDNYDEATKRVDLGTVEITGNDASKDRSITLYNHKYVEIKGKVWRDEDPTKTGGYNHWHDSNDTLLNGMTVKLYSNGEELATATTNTNGEYTLDKDKEGNRIIYWNMEDSYVSFEYDNREYITVNPFAGNSEAESSKAQEQTMTREALDDRNLDGNGNAITERKSGNLIKYYSENTYTIENINLGLITRHEPQYSITEELAYITVKLNGYKYTYKYDEEEVENFTLTGVSYNVPTTSLQTYTGFYTTQIYPSDIAYNVENGGNKLEVYPVYKITVHNDETTNIDELYKEEKLYLNSLTNYYDTSRYTLSIDNEDDLHHEDFMLWSNKADISSEGRTVGVTEYDVNNGVYKDGIGPNGAISSYIQFKMKDDALNAILNQDFDTYSEEVVPTITKTNAYHEYLRKDNVWEEGTRAYRSGYVPPNDYYLHRSEDKDESSYALYIHIKLGKDRVLSGNIFEDTLTREIEDTNGNIVKIGNGVFDTDENIIKNVKVELLNEDKTSVTKLYKKDSTNIKQYVIQDAILNTDNNGKYSIEGVVPGKYYLRFTYGDGTQKIVDMTSGEEKDVKINDYSSTKINEQDTSTIKNAYENPDENEDWYKNLKEDKPSVAVDDLELRRTYDDNTYEKRQSGTTTDQGENADANPIMAFTPKTSISIENDVNNQMTVTSVNGNEQKNVYDKFNFGIIHVPNVIVNINKEITNIDIVTQVGATLVSGNPKSTETVYLSDLDKISENGSKYAKLETELENLYGAKAKITYKLTVTNNSEKDYIETDEEKIGDYFKYGIIKDDTVEKKTKVEVVTDYIDSKFFGAIKNSEGNIEYKEEKQQRTIGVSGETIDVNPLIITGWETGGFTTEQSQSIEYTAEFTVSADDDLSYYNDAEITKIKLDKLTTLQSEFKWDDDETIFTITPPTGKNKQDILIIAVEIALIIILTGIIIIKKKER